MEVWFASRNLDRVQSPIIVGPPDLIIEVISEGNRSHDTVVKFQDYERYGVTGYWLVDPREQHITIWKLEQSRYQPLGVLARGQNLQTRVWNGRDLDPAGIF
jgi:Uma2 family endonuclease